MQKSDHGKSFATVVGRRSSSSDRWHNAKHHMRLPHSVTFACCFYPPVHPHALILPILVEVCYDYCFFIFHTACKCWLMRLLLHNESLLWMAFVIVLLPNPILLAPSIPRTHWYYYQYYYYYHLLLCFPSRDLWLVRAFALCAWWSQGHFSQNLFLTAFV